MERIVSEEAVLVQDLEATTRGTKGFGSSDRGTPRPDIVTKQSCTSAESLTNQPWKVTGRSGTQDSHNQHPKNAETLLSEPLDAQHQTSCQEAPRQEKMTEQCRAGAGLLTKQGCKVTDPADQHRRNNKAQQPEKDSKKIYISEITSQEFR